MVVVDGAMLDAMGCFVGMDDLAATLTLSIGIEF